MVVLRHFSLPLSVQYVLAAIPIFAGCLYMNAMVCDVRRQMDELQLRIYLEAAAVVVCGLFPMMCTYPLLQSEHLVGPLDWGIVLIILGVLGTSPCTRALRRYR